MIEILSQKMVNSEISGVAFSRNPIHPLDRENLIVEAVYGQGEGLVSGALEADTFTVHREDFEYELKLAKKNDFASPTSAT